MKKTKLIFGVFLATTCFVACGWFLLKEQFTCKNTQCLSGDIEKNWQLGEEFENSKQTYRALWKKSDYQLKIDIKKNLSQEDAELLTKVAIMKLKGLFDNAASPYPGAISDEFACGERYKPEVTTRTENSITFTTFTGYLDSRLQYGICLDEQLTYRVFSSYFYCKEQANLFHIELISPREVEKNDEEMKSMLSSFSCK